VTANGAGYVVDPHAPETVTAAIREGTHTISISGAGLALVASPGALEIVDLAVGRSWPLANRDVQPILVAPTLSSDATAVAGAFAPPRHGVGARGYRRPRPRPPPGSRS